MFKNAKKLIELKLSKKEVELSLRKIKGEIEEIEDILKEEFIENGMQSMVVDGQNLILTEKSFAAPDQSIEIVEWLRDNGYDHVFSKPINTTSFTSLYNKELTYEEKAEIGDHVTTGSKFTFQMRKK